MLNKEKAIKQLNQLIEMQGKTSGELFVSEFLYKLVLDKFKTDMFRGFKIKCAKGVE